jgi:hypothetical protein
VTITNEVRQMFRVQQLLRHPDAAVREKAALRLVKLAHLGRHPVIHGRALDLLGQSLGCDLIQARTRDRVVALPAATSCRIPRVAATR